MPKPSKGEEKGHYIARCVKQVMAEGKDQDAALGACYGMWRQHHKETAKSFLEVLVSAFKRGPPRLAQGVGTEVMDEKGIPVMYPASYIGGGDDDSEDEKDIERDAPEDEDVDELVDEATSDLELRAKTFNQIVKLHDHIMCKQPSVQAVHVPSASGGRRRRVSTMEDDKLQRNQELEAEFTQIDQSQMPGENRKLERTGRQRRAQGPEDTEKRDDGFRWTLPLNIAKADPDKRLIFGWASVVESDGQVIVDKQGDIIPAEALEDAAYEYVLSSRDGGDMHARRGVSKLVASVVLTPDIKRAMGITKMEPDHVGWFVGFKVHDDDLWSAIKRGERPEFSIGGASRVAEVESVETYMAHAGVFKARKGRRTTRPPFRW
jgi:hypothetical protein